MEHLVVIPPFGSTSKRKMDHRKPEEGLQGPKTGGTHNINPTIRLLDLTKKKNPANLMETRHH